MAKHFGLSLLLMAVLLVGCGQKMATQEEATRGMDNVQSYGDQLGAEKGAAKSAGAPSPRGPAKSPGR